MTTCKAQRRDGQPCTVRALADGYCFAHSPSTADKRRMAHTTGGRNSAGTKRVNKLVPATLRPLLQTLLVAVDEVHAGKLTAAQASAMAALAGAVVKFYETAELTERLLALESKSEQAS